MGTNSIGNRCKVRVYLKDEVAIFFREPIDNFAKMFAFFIATVTFKGRKSMSTGKFDLTSPEDFIPMLESVKRDEEVWPAYLRIARTSAESLLHTGEIWKWVKQLFLPPIEKPESISGFS